MFSIAIDTSHPTGQFCIFEGTQLLVNEIWGKEKSHSEWLTPISQKIFLEKKIDISLIEKIYLVIGPGSFTGLRVGVNFSKSLAYSLDVPIVPLVSLDILSLNATSFDKPIFSFMDAQRNAVFAKRYKYKNNQIEADSSIEICHIDDLDKYIDEESFCCGTGLSRYYSHFSEALKNRIISSPELQTSDLTKIVTHESMWQTSSVHWNDIQPMYIRASAAEEKLQQKT